MDTSPSTSEEWIGGVITLHSFNDETGAPQQLEGMFWLLASGDLPIVGSVLVEHGDAVPRAAEILNEVMREPIFGEPRRPQRVRVADPLLGAALRDAFVDIDVRVGETPELAPLTEQLRGPGMLFPGELATPSVDEPVNASPNDFLTELGDDVPSADIAEFFAAAAELFRAAPWTELDLDDHLLVLQSTALQLSDAVVIVLGRGGSLTGLVCFSSRADYVAYLDALEHRTALPSHLTLTFHAADELSLGARDKIHDASWPIAGASAYPTVIAFNAGRRIRGPDRAELMRMHAFCAAITALVAAPAPRRRCAISVGAVDIAVDIAAR